MAMSTKVARYSIVVGVFELVVAGLCVIVGIISLGLGSDTTIESAGLWALVFSVPGILLIVAGKRKHTTTMSVALGFNIVATIVSLVVFIGGIRIWQIVSLECGTNETRSSSIDCSKKSQIISAIAAVTFIMLFLAIICLLGSILGCLGTCCAPRDQSIIPIRQQSAAAILSTQGITQYPAPSAIYNPATGPRHFNLSAERDNRASFPPAYTMRKTYV